MTHTFRSGYVALTSALIITAIFVVVVLSLSLAAFLGRNNILHFYFKDQSYALAESCVQGAFLRLVGNASYTGGETVTVGTSTCTVVSVTDTGSEKVIKTKGVFRGATTNLSITINKVTFIVTNWQEISHF